MAHLLVFFSRWGSGYFCVRCWLWTSGPNHVFIPASRISGPKRVLLTSHKQSQRKVQPQHSPLSHSSYISIQLKLTHATMLWSTGVMEETVVFSERATMCLETPVLVPSSTWRWPTHASVSNIKSQVLMFWLFLFSVGQYTNNPIVVTADDVTVSINEWEWPVWETSRKPNVVSLQLNIQGIFL